MSGWLGSALAAAVAVWALRRLLRAGRALDAECEADMAAFRNRERDVLAETARIVDECAAVLEPLYVEVDS